MHSILRNSTFALICLPLLLAACSSGPEAGRPVNIVAEDGVVLQGRIIGRGVVGIVLVHEADSDQTEWTEFATNLSARGFSVITFDLRGHGKSPDLKQLGIADTDASAALRTLRQKAGIKPVFIMGVGIGGTAALKVASRESVNGVVAISAPGSQSGLNAIASISRIKSAKLYLTTEDDKLRTKDAQTMFDLSVEPRELRILTGKETGIELLKGSPSGEARRFIFEFLDRNR